MKFTLVVLLLGLFAPSARAELNEAMKPVDNCVHDESTFRCVKYIRNYDADSVTVTIPNVHPLLGELISIRIKGIDTGEMKSKATCEKDRAIAAQQMIEKILIGAKRINLKNIGRDKYFRILADVEVDGQFLKDQLLKENLAYSYNGGTKQKIDWCQMGKRQPASKDKP